MTDKFFENVASLIEQARTHVGRTADLTMCVTYFEVGRMIVEQEQDGEARAKYGKKLLAELSKYLNSRFKKGFSQTNLRNARKFYQVYAPSIQQMTSAEFEKQKQQITSAEFQNNNLFQILPLNFYPFQLGWSHYLILMRIGNEQERRFYEIESLKGQWTYKYLRRQFHSSLYERLALSRDKDEILRLANEGQTIEKPRDILKSPLSLEFLGLEESVKYSESDLENAIIDKMQKFLLELGKGFLFEARQKRFTFDENSFWVDLVFYNRLLDCYVIIDLKTGELEHRDLGQMMMYVNYFDRHVKTEKENPTIGILLCKDKNDSVVEMTLPENTNIYASAYNLYLPDKSLLQEKLAEWVQEFEDAKVILEIENNAATDEMR
ncbi:MAG: PDDEXK nuclease domain-containing protein [Oscillospiraceae bacterium]|nr:PDDEXK nuclease domain-containing protein [Oscillospiraceae bacterium]